MRNHFLHLALVCLAVTVNLAQAQLSAKAQENLINLANAEISKQIVNGSDNKSANQSAQTQQSFLKVVLWSLPIQVSVASMNSIKWTKEIEQIFMRSWNNKPFL